MSHWFQAWVDALFLDIRYMVDSFTDCNAFLVLGVKFDAQFLDEWK